jgi:hypothetical protein
MGPTVELGRLERALLIFCSYMRAAWLWVRWTRPSSERSDRSSSMSFWKDSAALKTSDGLTVWPSSWCCCCGRGAYRTPPGEVACEPPSTRATDDDGDAWREVEGMTASSDRAASEDSRCEVEGTRRYVDPKVYSSSSSSSVSRGRWIVGSRAAIAGVEEAVFAAWATVALLEATAVVDGGGGGGCASDVGPSTL